MGLRKTAPDNVAVIQSQRASTLMKGTEVPVLVWSIIWIAEKFDQLVGFYFDVDQARQIQLRLGTALARKPWFTLVTIFCILATIIHVPSHYHCYKAVCLN